MTRPKPKPRPLPEPTTIIIRVASDHESTRKEWWKWVYGGQRNPLNDVKWEDRKY